MSSGDSGLVVLLRTCGRCLLGLVVLGALGMPAQAQVRIELLPDDSLRPSIWADGREAMTRVSVRSGHSPLEVTLAERVELVALKTDAWAVSLAMGGSGDLAFQPEGGMRFPLSSFDGHVSFPLTIRYSNWTHSLAWSHVSAHFADGIRDVLGYGQLNTEPYSREFLRWLSSWRVEKVRVYWGARLLFHSIPDAPPWGLQLGVQADELIGPVFAAVDVQSNEEHQWTPRIRTQLGVRFDHSAKQAVQLGVELAQGPDEKGKWDGRDDPYLGVFLAIEP